MNNSVTTPGMASASPAACGPSARNDRARCRNARLASCRADLTRGERMLVSSGPAAAVMPGPRRLTGAASGRRGTGRGLVRARLREGTLGDLHQSRERGRVRDGEFGEHPAVNLNTRGLEALDEPVVGHAVGPGRCIDALDPQPPERALPVLAVPVGVRHRVENLLLGLAVQPRPLASV